MAARLVDPTRRQAAIEQMPLQTHFPRSVHWSPSSLAQGEAGVALACGYLDRCLPDHGWDEHAHRLLAVAAEDAARRSPHGSLFAGLSGLGLLAWWLGRDGTRYARFGQTVDAALDEQTASVVQTVRARGPHGVPVGSIDLVSGLAGVGAYLLLRRASSGEDETLHLVLSTLVELGTAPGPVPRWWTPPGAMGAEVTDQQYPTGSLNCGLAHGVPGPLALCALALTEGMDVPGLRTATAQMSRWLIEHRRDDEWGPNWPAMVGLEERPERDHRSSRAAWCYGSPGVARALWLAGVALEDEELTSLAVESMAAVFRRPIAERNLDSPSLCHGVAGLLQITLRFAADTGLPVFVDAARQLAGQVMAAYEPASVLGFRNLEPDGTRVDHAGLLDGAPGVMLVLLAATTDIEPAWDRMFLLS